MDNHYLLKSSEDFSSFEFVSEGPKGIITKVVQFRRVPGAEYYNLGLTDKDEIRGCFRDDTISNNCDTQKVLATVAEAVRQFTEFNPKALVYATGNSQARTRLYRMGISNNLKQIERTHFVFGFCNGHWLPFEKGENYAAFLVRRK